MFDLILRAQPVVPFAFTIERLNPPMKPPQVMPAASNRSPMLWPPNCACVRFGLEQTSPSGSASPIRVIPPLPSLTSYPGVGAGGLGFRPATTPFVWPDTRLPEPGVEGPDVVP